MSFTAIKRFSSSLQNHIFTGLDDTEDFNSLS